MDPTEHQAPGEDRDAAVLAPSTSAGSDSTAWHVGAPAAAENAATTRLATMADLDRLSADLDRIDATLAELDAK